MGLTLWRSSAIEWQPPPLQKCFCSHAGAELRLPAGSQFPVLVAERETPAIEAQLHADDGHAGLGHQVRLFRLHRASSASFPPSHPI